MSLLETLLASKKTSALIESAFDDIDRMLVHSQRMLEIALASLLDNEELTDDLDRMDDEVDHGEQMVRRAVLQHLSVQPGDDLVASLTLVSIVQDCERIGDFARSLGELSGLARSQRTGVFRDQLDAVRTKVLPMFEDTSAAFTSSDVEKAQGVVTAASHLKSDLADLVKGVAASDLSADMAVTYSASARVLSRVTSHLSNVCSTVTQPFDRMRHGDEE